MKIKAKKTNKRSYKVRFRNEAFIKWKLNSYRSFDECQAFISGFNMAWKSMRKIIDKEQNQKQVKLGEKG